MKAFKYNKIVRDLTPERIAAEKGWLDCKHVRGKEKLLALNEKLHKEVDKLMSVQNKNEQLEELVDMIEIIYSYAKELGISQKKITSKRIKKKQEYGGFDSGIFVTRISFPESYRSNGHCLRNSNGDQAIDYVL
jgi:predicted house-cleaning noncanonical NTP pyrophosphatase (MazG superfamily)